MDHTSFVYLMDDKGVFITHFPHAVTPDKLAAYRNAGANGFGLGSALYAPGMSLEKISANASEFRASVGALSQAFAI